MANQILGAKQQKAAYVQTMSNITGKAAREKRSLTDAESADFDGLMAKANALTLVIEGAEGRGLNPGIIAQPIRPDQANRENDTDGAIVLRSRESLSARVGTTLANGGDASEFSLGRLLRAQILGDRAGSEFEQRALGEGSGSGAYLLPSPVSAQFIDLARNACQCVNAGVQTIAFESGKLAIPRMDGDVTAAWNAEGALFTESAPTFDAVTATARTLMSLTRLSNELLADCPELAGKMITESLSKSLGVELDRCILRGDGTNNSPTGIKNAANILTGATAAGNHVIAMGDLITARAAVLGANEEPNAIVMAPSVDAFLDGLQDSQLRWLGYPPALGLIPRFHTGQIPVVAKISELYLGDFTKAAIMLRAQISIETSNAASDAFLRNQTWVRAIMRCDVAVLRPKAFYVLTGVQTIP
jgi:HK97 family phage major capsid protein